MKFRFVGEFTGKRTSINAGGVIFEGHEPTEVECPELIRRLRANPEFKAVGGRPKKNADPVEG